MKRQLRTQKKTLNLSIGIGLSIFCATTLANGIPSPKGMCRDMNSPECADSESSIDQTASGVKQTQGNQSKQKFELYRDGLNDSTEIGGAPRATSYCFAPEGDRIKHGTSRSYFLSQKSVNCAAEEQVRTCDAGVLSGSALFPTCIPFVACTGPGYSIPHNGSGTFSNAAKSTNCETATRTCNDGSLSGSSALTHFGSCVPFASCTHQGVSIPHGGSRSFFRVGQSSNCASESTTVSCNDGAVSGSNLSYSFISCSEPPPPADCSARTHTWSVGGNTCQGNSPSRASGSSAFVSSTNGNSGSATYSCNNGTWTGPFGASCAAPPVAPPTPASCTSRTLSWTASGRSCSGTAPSRGSGQSATISSSNGNNGSATFACTNGTWGPATAASCAAPPVSTPPPSTPSGVVISDPGPIPTSLCSGKSVNLRTDRGFICTTSEGVSFANANGLSGSNSHSFLVSSYATPNPGGRRCVGPDGYKFWLETERAQGTATMQRLVTEGLERDYPRIQTTMNSICQNTAQSKGFGGTWTFTSFASCSCAEPPPPVYSCPSNPGPDKVFVSEGNTNPVAGTTAAYRMTGETCTSFSWRIWKCPTSAACNLPDATSVSAFSSRSTDGYGDGNFSVVYPSPGTYGLELRQGTLGGQRTITVR